MAEQQQQPAEASGEERVVSIAIDGSEHSKYAFKFYLDHVRKPSDKLYLVHAVEINSVLHSTQWYSSPYSFDRETLMKCLDEEKEKIKKKLEGYAALLKEAGVDGTVKSIHAESPGEGIIKAANENKSDLIIVGSRGMGTIRRTFIGSISDYVLHHSPVPVLICRHETVKEKHHEHHH